MGKSNIAPGEYCSNCGEKATEAEVSSGKCLKCGGDVIPVEVLLEDDFFMEGLF